MKSTLRSTKKWSTKLFKEKLPGKKQRNSLSIKNLSDLLTIMMVSSRLQRIMLWISWTITHQVIKVLMGQPSSIEFRDIVKKEKEAWLNFLELPTWSPKQTASNWLLLTSLLTMEYPIEVTGKLSSIKTTDILEQVSFQTHRKFTLSFQCHNPTFRPLKKSHKIVPPPLLNFNLTVVFSQKSKNLRS